MASVPTGIPAGICTMECRLSTPDKAFDSTGTPNTGSGVSAAANAGQVRRAARAGDHDPEALGLGALGEGEEPVRRSVGRDDARIVGDLERVERLRGVPPSSPSRTGCP